MCGGQNLAGSPPDLALFLWKRSQTVNWNNGDNLDLMLTSG